MRATYPSRACLALTFVTLLSSAALAQEGSEKKSSVIEITEVQRAEPVDFAKDILPIFQQNCLACHNEKEREGELVLETPDAIRKGGDAGPAIVAGKGMESLLLSVSAKLEKPFMPPRNNKVGANPLTPAELGLLKLWIDQGAKGDSVAPKDGAIQWHPLPEGLNPIYAVAATLDGQLAACNRANQIFVYSLPRRQLLTRLTDPALLSSVGHGRPGVAHRDLVQSLAFSPDGKLLASGGYREVKIWQRPDPAARLTLTGVASKRVGAIAASPDSKIVAVGSDEGVIQLYDLSDGKLRSELKGHIAEVTGLRFSSDGSQLFSASIDKSLRTWDVSTGKPLTTIQTPGPVTAMLAMQAPGGSPQLISAGGDNAIRRWSVPATSPEIVEEIPRPISAVAVSPGGKRVAVAGADNSIRIIDAASGHAGPAFPGSASQVRALGFDASSKQLFAASTEGVVTLWDVEAAKPSQTVIDASGPLTAASIRPDGKQVATATGDGRISLWRLDAPAARELGSPDESVATLGVVSPNQQLIATVNTIGGKPAILVRNIASGEIAQKLQGFDAAITAIAFSPDSTRIVAGSADKTARVWTLVDGKEIARFAGHGAGLTAIAFLSDNARVISAGSDGSLKIWTVAEGREEKSISGHVAEVTAIGLLPSNQLVTATANQTLNVIDLATGAPIRSTLLDAAPIALSVSRDGARFAIATADKKLRIVNSADGVVQRIIATPSAASGISFNADGKRIVAAVDKRATVYGVEDGVAIESLSMSGIGLVAFGDRSDELLTANADKTIQVTSLRFIASLAGASRKITRLLYAKDGSLVIAASEDGSLRGFSSSDGSLKYTAAHGSPIRDAAISPDGNWMSTGGEDGTIKLWAAGTGAAGPKPLIGSLGKPVTAVAFSNDSRRIFAAPAASNEVTVFDREQAIVLEGMVSQSLPSAMLAVLESPASGPADVLLSASSGKSLRVLRSSLLGQWQGHTGVVTSLAAVPSDPLRFMSGSIDGTIRQWNLNSANADLQFAHGGPVSDIAIRGDGKLVGSAGGAVAKIFDAKTGAVTATLRGDRLSTEFAQLTERRLTLAQTELAICKQQLDAAVAAQAANTQAVVKLVETKTAAEKIAADKATAAATKTAARDAANKALADTVAGTEFATRNVASVDNQIAEAKRGSEVAIAKATEVAAALQKLTSEAPSLAAGVTTAQSKVDVSSADAAVKAKGATDAKAASDAAASAMEVTARAAAEAKAAAEKDPANAALQEAAVAAASAATGAASAAKSSSESAATAQKLSDEAAAAASVASTALSAARRQAEENAAATKLATLLVESTQKRVTEATVGAQKATEAKTTADKALVAAKAKQAEADTKSKQATAETAQAESELKVAKFNAEAADQAVIAGKANAAKVDQETSDKTAAHLVAQSAAAKEKIDLDNARKTAAADAEKPVNAIAFSPDGASVATAGEDGVVHLYSADSGRAAEELPGHTSPITALAFAPDGTIFSGSADRTVKQWDANPAWTLKATLGTGDEKSPLVDRVLSLAFSPDGTLLATGGGIPSRSGELKLWSVATGQLFREFPEAHSDTVYGLSFSGDGSLLASGGADKFAKVWNVSSGTLFRSFEGHTHHVLDVSLRYDGRVLVTCGADNAVKLWNVQNGTQLASNAQFSKFEVTSVAHVGFTDRFLATTGEGTVRLLREDLGVDRAFDVTTPAATFLYAGATTADGSLVITGGYDSILRIRDARDGKVVADLGPPATQPSK